MALNLQAFNVWFKPLVLKHDGTLYHVRLFDTQKHSCVLQASNKTGEQIEELVAWHKAAGYPVKAFAYEMNSSEYESKSRPVTFQTENRRTRYTKQESIDGDGSNVPEEGTLFR
jgi:uncharacterized protein YigE (DUF2233 family)